MRRSTLWPLYAGILLVACQPGDKPTAAGEQPTSDPPTEAAVPAQASPTLSTLLPTVPNAEETAVPGATATAVPTTTAEPEVTPTIMAGPVDAIGLEPVVTDGLFKPTFLTHAGDGRLFVTEQHGQIRIIENGQLIDESFLNIQSRVGSDANEQGLLSVVFAPDYATSGRFYVNYTNTGGDTVVARFQVSADPNLADPNSEEILLTVGQPFPNHNGGQLQFGPDGYLYVGMGDGGSGGDPQNHGQNPSTLLGSILRLDVSGETYTIPPDNPFVSSGDARGEAWSYGWRNPWRFSFDRLTGDLYTADVGQNQWEEINFQPASSAGGENYGWNIMEASHCFNATTCDQTGLVLPIFEYDHSQGCSITGGYVYRGPQYPELTGNYFLSDFCTGFIWRLFPDGNGGWRDGRILESGLNVSSFGEDVNGELYVLDHGGAVYQVTSASP